MRIEMMHCTQSIMQLIDDKKATRDIVVTAYALALCSSEETDWPKVNRAIIARWSISALEYIKTKAWKMINKKREDTK